MGIFHRKSKWERFSIGLVERSSRLAAGAAHNSSVKAGAAVATGAVALTAASAAVSALRQRAKS